jgi:hypothetical protein
MKNNTVVTAGDSNYLWGLFLLVASMRKSGMDEPVLVGTKKFDARCEKVLKQFGDVAFHSLDNASHNLTCHKAEVMMKAGTEYVTWADSDALFSGNCSEFLAPPDHAKIHVRRRSAAEMPGAFPPPYDLNEILPVWKSDVEAVCGEPSDMSLRPSDFRSCSACFLSFARDQERFLDVWHRMMMRLPAGDAGVVNRALKFYHQLDESCLNATLLYSPGAPEVTETYRLDKELSRLFVHFCGRPKPWVFWIPSSLRHYDATVSIVDWAIREKLELPGPVPAPFRTGAASRSLAFLGARPREFVYKARRKLGL